jgi:hypothetical protein
VHSSRAIFVLMDQQSFNETNLKDIFRSVSGRFPKPAQLSITVFTSLQQLPTPEEQDYMMRVPEDSLPFFANVDRFPSANYSRLRGQEKFDYSMGNGDQKRTVVISDKKTAPRF